MTIDPFHLIDPKITCASCLACCCRLEVLLITDTGVPEHLTDIDAWGGQVMARLDDGWCAALDRNTLLCIIYDKRPLVCRDFAMGGGECKIERELCPDLNVSPPSLE